MKFNKMMIAALMVATTVGSAFAWTGTAYVANKRIYGDAKVISDLVYFNYSSIGGTYINTLIITNSGNCNNGSITSPSLTTYPGIMKVSESFDDAMKFGLKLITMNTANGVNATVSCILSTGGAFNFEFKK